MLNGNTARTTLWLLTIAAATLIAITSACSPTPATSTTAASQNPAISTAVPALHVHSEPEVAPAPTLPEHVHPVPTATPTPPPLPQPPPPAPVAGQRTPTLPCTSTQLFPQRTQRSLAVDPTNEQKLYIGVEQDGFFKSTDGGKTWQRATNGLKAWQRTDGTGPCYEEFYETVINPKNPDQMCIAMAGGPGIVSTPAMPTNNGVYCSQNAGATWTQMVSPTMNLAVYALVADPRDFNVMYAGVNGGPCSNGPPICAVDQYFNTTGAIYKTTDGGKTWTELNALYTADMRVIVLKLDELNPDVVIAATFSKLPPVQAGPGAFGDLKQTGVLRSTDGGNTWKSSITGMTTNKNEQALLMMASAPTNGNNVYVTASANQGYYSTDGGVTFTKSTRLDTYAYDPHDPSGMHMLGASETIRESMDGGKTWTNKSPVPGLAVGSRAVPTDIEFGRITPGLVYLAGPNATLYRSSNGGSTWVQILSADKLPK